MMVRVGVSTYAPCILGRPPFGVLRSCFFRSSATYAFNVIRYSGSRQSVEIAPKYGSAGLRSFWSTATAWGVFDFAPGRLKLTVIEGKLLCRSVKLRTAVKTFTDTMEITPAEPLVVSL